MSILNSLRKQVTGAGIANWGAPTGYGSSASPAFSSVNNSLSGTGAQNTALAFPTGVTLSRGKLRVRVYSFGGTNPTIIARAYLYDGTNAVDVLLPLATFGPTLTTSPGPCGVDMLREFCVEISATSLCVVTTLAGTSPTAQLDIEAYGPQ